jgi:hypothetical protein
MSIPERVGALLRSELGRSLCDDCSAAVLGFARRQQAAADQRLVGRIPRLRTAATICARCGGEKQVIRAT